MNTSTYNHIQSLLEESDLPDAILFNGHSVGERRRQEIREGNNKKQKVQSDDDDLVIAEEFDDHWAREILEEISREHGISLEEKVSLAELEDIEYQVEETNQWS